MRQIFERFTDKKSKLSYLSFVYPAYWIGQRIVFVLPN